MKSGRALRVLGLMSGTSCDGVTVAGAAISGPPRSPSLKCLGFLERAYPAPLRRRLLAVGGGAPAGAAELAALHVELAEFWSRAALALRGRGRPRLPYDLLASHGHTVHHHPPGRGSRGWSLQIGDAATLAARTGLPVAFDFRSRDLALGGHGAPLVPRPDAVLFGSGSEPRVALNLGGIANITVLPAGRGIGGALAFDTGPGNMVIDALIRRSTRGVQQFDRGGRTALRGEPDAELLGRWLAHPYFRAEAPKSTGREEFGEVFLKPALRAVARRRLGWADAVATATLLTSWTVACAIREHARPGTRLVIGAGGGMKNRALTRQLEALLAPMRLAGSEEFGVPGPAREALAFALLGYFTWHRIPGNLPSATGASAEAVLGSLTR